MPHDVDFLAGMFAYGAMIAFAIAHLSVIALRFREPDRPSAFRVPLSIPIRGAKVPLPAVFGRAATRSRLGERRDRSTRARGTSARPGWRRASRSTWSTGAGRASPLHPALHDPRGGAPGDAEAPSTAASSCPCSASALDDDIVGTAGRLAADEASEGEGGAVLEALYVFEMPMSLPLDAGCRTSGSSEARAALRARQGGGGGVRGRGGGHGDGARPLGGPGDRLRGRRRGVEAIVLAAEEPSRMRGGAMLGGRGGAARPVRGGGDPLRGREGALQGDPHRAPAGDAGDRAQGVAPAAPRSALARAARRSGCRVAPYVRPDRRFGRVGSAIAKTMLAEGHEVSVLDEDPEAIALLDKGQAQSWEDLGGRSPSAPRSRSTPCIEAGIERADAFVASTDGDNTNLVIAQIAQRRFKVEAWWCGCSTRPARSGTRSRGCRPSARRRSRSRCSRRPSAVDPEGWRASDVRHHRRRRQGGLEPRPRADRQGQRGDRDRERPLRFATVEEELEHAAQYGDGSELWVLERAGIERADLVIAVTGDDEDNILICQMAREKYGVER